MNPALIVVVADAELRRVSLKEEILSVQIGDDHLLFPPLERVQPAVRVFLEQIEIRQVVLPAVRIQIPEKSHAGLLVHEQKPPKIGVELLNSRAYGNKIEIRPDIVQLQLAEHFLKSQMPVEPRGAVAHVHRHDAQLAHRQVIRAHRRRDPNPPVHRTKRRVAMKQVERENKKLIQKNLLALAEESGRSGLRCAHAARHRQPPPVEERVADPGEIEKDLLPDHRHITLPFVFVERIPLAPVHVGMLAARAVAIPFRHRHAPAVRLGLKNLAVGRKCLGRGVRRRTRLKIGTLLRARISRRRRFRAAGRRCRRRKLLAFRGRRRRRASRRHQLDLARQQITGRDRHIPLDQSLIARARNAYFILPSRHIHEPEHSLGIRSGFANLAGSQIPQ